jgi:hypothetical protein
MVTNNINYVEFIYNEILYTGIYIVILYFISYLLKPKYDDTTQSFIIHFVHNMIITYIVTPYCLMMLSDPIGVNDDYLLYKNNYEFLFPMISGLHTFHLLKSYKKIQFDEIIHHIITYTFGIINYILSHPFYYSYLIIVSGIPGGITYLLLFLQKIGLIELLTEKKISYLLNVWIRAPFTIVWATLAYNRLIYVEESIINKILILVSIIIIPLNGIHFMTTIAESYHRHNINKNI